MDGPFYVDSRPPFSVSTPPAVTLTGNYKCLAPAAYLPQLGSNYFGYVGKAVRITAYGTGISGATPGNINFGLIYGPNTDNVGAVIGGVGFAWTANSTGVWRAEFVVRCRALGASGVLTGMGNFHLQNSGIVIAPPQTLLLPTCDLTQNYYLSFQSWRSGSTVETMQQSDYFFESLN